MIYSKKKKREKKEPWAFCVKLSPEIASSFWGKKLVFKKKASVIRRRFLKSLSRLLGSLFPSDTPHCLGLRLRVLAKERV